MTFSRVAFSQVFDSRPTLARASCSCHSHTKPAHWATPHRKPNRISALPTRRSKARARNTLASACILGRSGRYRRAHERGASQQRTVHTATQQETARRRYRRIEAASARAACSCTRCAQAARSRALQRPSGRPSHECCCDGCMSSPVVLHTTSIVTHVRRC